MRGAISDDRPYRDTNETGQAAGAPNDCLPERRVSVIQSDLNGAGTMATA